MAKADKDRGPDEPVFDVSEPGKSAPPSSSKPIIVTNRPVLQDPMMAHKPAEEQASSKLAAPHLPSEKAKIAPLDNTLERPKLLEKPSSPDDTTTKEEDSADSAPTKKKSAELDEATLQVAAERATKLDELVESHKYYLPINQVEKRRSQHYVIFGIVFIIILGLAWADVALDAGIINLPGLKTHTHFFR